MILQVAAGILLAAVVIGLIALGFSIAGSPDARFGGEYKLGLSLAGIGLGAGAAIVYFAVS